MPPDANGTTPIAMTAAAKVHDSSSAGNGRSPDAKGQPAAPPADAPHPWRLVTISCSHYCDKARWALDMAGACEGAAGALAGMASAQRAEGDGGVERNSCTPARLTPMRAVPAAGHPYEEDMYPPFIHLGGTLLGGLKKRTTPQLVSPDKQQVIADSTDILRWAARTYPDTPAGRLYPKGLEEQVHRWEDKFNRGLGPQVRAPERVGLSFCSGTSAGWSPPTGRVRCRGSVVGQRAAECTCLLACRGRGPLGAKSAYAAHGWLQSRVVAYYHLFKSPGAKAVVPLVNCPVRRATLCGGGNDPPGQGGCGRQARHPLPRLALPRPQDMPPWRAWAFKTFYPVITSLMRVPMKIYADNTRVCTEK